MQMKEVVLYSTCTFIFLICILGTHEIHQEHLNAKGKPKSMKMACLGLISTYR